MVVPIAKKLLARKSSRRALKFSTALALASAIAGGCSALLGLDELRKESCVDGSCGPDPSTGVHVSREIEVVSTSDQSAVGGPRMSLREEDSSVEVAPELWEEPGASAENYGPSLMAALCNPPDIADGEWPPECGPVSDGAADVTFSNRCVQEPVELYELDDECLEVPRGNLDPGQFVRLRTFSGRWWRFRNASTHRLIGEFVVDRSAKHWIPGP